MKKAFLSILMVLCCLIASAQIPSFKLKPSGEFMNSNFEKYEIYPVKNKTAHELYEMVCANISKVYKSPKDVMSVVEDKSIAIRAFSDELVISEKMFGAPLAYYSCYYNLLFEFKDGKIKVSAPIIDEVYTNTSRDKFSRVASKYFDKKGKPKKNKSMDISRVENEFFLLFCHILEVDDKNDDW